ncbi:MAG: hypothetical protein JXB07_03450 [Anaerolineae bacterium]|nr:hypothetical protein [Anaerolineae bacterium]
MKRELMPYYISRVVLSAGMGVFFALIGNWPWWIGLGMGILTFAGFLWYAHSGNYLIDPSTPLTPLRRDVRGKAIRDQSVVTAVMVAGVAYAALTLIRLGVPFLSDPGKWALLLGVLAYFGVSNWLFTRGS